MMKRVLDRFLKFIDSYNKSSKNSMSIKGNKRSRLLEPAEDI